MSEKWKFSLFHSAHVFCWVCKREVCDSTTSTLLARLRFQMTAPKQDAFIQDVMRMRMGEVDMCHPSLFMSLELELCTVGSCQLR